MLWISKWKWLIASIGAVILLLVGAVAITPSMLEPQDTPTITASPDVKLKHDEPKIIADKKAKVPQSRPEVKTTPAPEAAPATVAETRDGYIPLRPIQEQAPYLIVPEPAPAQSPLYRLPPAVTTPTFPSIPTNPTRPSVPLKPPVIPAPSPLLPPVVTEPVEPVTGPVKGTPDPVTDLVNPLIPAPLPTIPRLSK